MNELIDECKSEQSLVNFQEVCCPGELVDTEQNCPKLSRCGSSLLLAFGLERNFLADETFLPASVSENTYSAR